MGLFQLFPAVVCGDSNKRFEHRRRPVFKEDILDNGQTRPEVRHLVFERCSVPDCLSGLSLHLEQGCTVGLCYRVTAKEKTHCEVKRNAVSPTAIEELLTPPGVRVSGLPDEKASPQLGGQ